MSLEKLNKYSPILSFLLSFILTLIVIMYFSWSVTIIATIIGGFLCLEMKWGAISGALAVVSAWMLNFIFSMNDIGLQVDQLGRLIIGSNGAGVIIVLIIFTQGAVFGFLGGSIGSGIRMLVYPERPVT